MDDQHEQRALSHDGFNLPGRWVGPWLLVACLGVSWLGMQAVHELGHVLAAWATGATVEAVILYPLTFSRTLLGANPHPLVVCWSGAVLGCLLPLGLWGVVRALALRWSFLARLFLGFCLIANGLYLGTGPLTRGGDPGDLLALGAPAWQLVLFGAVTTALGLGSWNGLGPAFGFGKDAEQPDRRAALWVTGALLLLLAGEFLFSPR